MFLTIIINIAILYQSQYYISSIAVISPYYRRVHISTKQDLYRTQHRHNNHHQQFILKIWLILHARDPGKYERRGHPNSIGLGAEWTWRQCWIRRGASSASALQFENITRPFYQRPSARSVVLRMSPRRASLCSMARLETGRCGATATATRIRRLCASAWRMPYSLPACAAQAAHRWRNRHPGARCMDYQWQ